MIQLPMLKINQHYLVKTEYIYFNFFLDYEE